MAGEKTNGAWWKGSFPTWLIAALLGVCGFFMQREININDAHRAVSSDAITELKVRMHGIETRLGILEDTAQENHAILTEISKKIKY